MSDPVADQADAVLGALRASVVDSELCAVYLHGSAVDEGLRPDSDLDLLAVVDRPLGADVRRALATRLLPISGGATRPAAWRPLELTVVVAGDVRPWQYPPRLELQYGEWLRQAFLGDDPPGPRASPDLAVVLTAVRAASRPLIGLPADRLIDPVPRADLMRAMIDELPDLLANLEVDTRNVVLTLARMWATSVSAAVHSKSAAATLALEWVPAVHRPVLELARAAYVGERIDRWDDERAAARAFADFVADRIRSEVALPAADASV